MVLIRLTILIFFISVIISDDFTNVRVLDIKSRSEMKRYMKSISKDMAVIKIQKDLLNIKTIIINGVRFYTNTYRSSLCYI